MYCGTKEEASGVHLACCPAEVDVLWQLSSSLKANRQGDKCLCPKADSLLNCSGQNLIVSKAYKGSSCQTLFLSSTARKLKACMSG